MFGVEPKNEYEILICPHDIGIISMDCSSYCRDCKKEFWNSEYKESVKENE